MSNYNTLQLIEHSQSYGDHEEVRLESMPTKQFISHLENRIFDH